MLSTTSPAGVEEGGTGPHEKRLHLATPRRALGQHARRHLLPPWPLDLSAAPHARLVPAGPGAAQRLVVDRILPRLRDRRPYRPARTALAPAPHEPGRVVDHLDDQPRSLGGRAAPAA